MTAFVLLLFINVLYLSVKFMIISIKEVKIEPSQGI